MDDLEQFLLKDAIEGRQLEISWIYLNQSDVYIAPFFHDGHSIQYIEYASDCPR